MTSWQAHLVRVLIRLRIKRRLSGVTDPAGARAMLGATPPPPPRGVSIAAAEVGGVAGEWLSADAAGVATGAAPVLLYLHGGGYFACSPQTHRAITGGFARRGFRVFCPDYRLAPEHPCPAAVEDALAVYTALEREGDLLVAGDSAGGGLAVSMMVAAREAGLAMPLATCLFSPWTDLAVTGASVALNDRRDAMFTADALRRSTWMYLAGRDPFDPVASPLYADLRGLPPLLIHVDESEVLLDDSVRLAERMGEGGGEALVRRWRGVWHVWQLGGGFVPEARRSLDEAAEFLLARARIRA